MDLKSLSKKVPSTDMAGSKPPRLEARSSHHVGHLHTRILSAFLNLWLFLSVPAAGAPSPGPPLTGNPLFEGWFADPDAHIFGNKYWIYPTTSAPFDEQATFDAWSSKDLVTWKHHPQILDFADITWSTNRAAWAPSVAEKNGKFYMYFSAGQGVGIGVADSDSPAGPFTDALGKPLIGEWHFEAEPIDPAVFTDDDGQRYMYYGGRWRCVVVELEDNMKATKGNFLDITPPGYIEAPYMLKKDGVYYLMYSVGDFSDNSYEVHYVKADNPLGPFDNSNAKKILQGNPKIGTGAGHHSVLKIGKEYYIVYHRRFPHDQTVEHRVICIDRMHFTEDGEIEVVKITTEGVKARPLPQYINGVGGWFR